MTALEQALRTALLHFVWQGAAVAFLLWTALLLMRKRSANARYVASCLALMVLVALPVITASAVYTQPVAAQTGQRWIEMTPPGSDAWAWSGPSASPATWPAVWLDLLQSWALPAWLFGVALFSVRLAWGSRQVAVLRKRGEPAEGPVLAMAGDLARRMRVARPVRLLISALAEGPSVVGWIRPVILLPAATLAGLTPEQLEAVLAHEFAHIRRYDYLVNVLQMVVETLLFYHPAVWWVSTRIRHERELCCDDLAVGLCGDALCYARALTRLERLRLLAPKMAMGSTDGPLFYRIQRLTGAASRRLSPARLPSVLAIALGLACVGLCLNWARLHAQELRVRQAPKATPATPAPAQAVSDDKGVRVDLGGATVRERTPVEYPPAAIDDEVSGSVEVEATLDAHGAVQSVRALSGPEELRDAVLASVRKWTFQPGQGSLRLNVVFQLPNDDCDSDVEVDSDTDVDCDPDCDADVEVSDVENALDDVASHLQEAEAALEEAESELNDKTSDLSSQLEEAERALESAGLLSGRAELTDGRVLKRLRLLGLSDDLRTDLLKRLPVHEGDKLTKDVMEKLQKVLHDLDSRLSCVTIPMEDSDAALVIRRK
jgi:TonB family protein